MSLNVTIVLIATICHIPVGLVYLGWVRFSMQAANSEKKELSIGKSNYVLWVCIGMWPFVTILLLLLFRNNSMLILFSLHFIVIGVIYYVSIFYLVYTLRRISNSTKALGAIVLLCIFQQLSFLTFFIGLMELLAMFIAPLHPILTDRKVFSFVFFAPFAISQFITVPILQALKLRAAQNEVPHATEAQRLKEI